MKVLIRADASRWMGSGHIIRCLTLAERLARAGSECAFICVSLDGNLTDYIRERGFSVFELPEEAGGGFQSEQEDSTVKRDAQRTWQIVEKFEPDWVVVDHYGLEATWESAALPGRVKLLVLDDLANRSHNADVLVDQNLGRKAEDYQGLVPPSCEVLTGTRYALLRKEFRTLREGSVHRRRSGVLRSMLISFGGADSDNITGRILEFLIDEGLTRGLSSIVVVLGSQSVWKDEIADAVAELGDRGRLLCAVDNMAEVMSAADISIGGGGTSAWERCCLGLPSLMLAIADNQRPICINLDKSGGGVYLGDARSSDWRGRLPGVLRDLMDSPDKVVEMSRRAQSLCDGMGADRLVNRIVKSG